MDFRDKDFQISIGSPPDYEELVAYINFKDSIEWGLVHVEYESKPVLKILSEKKTEIDANTLIEAINEAIDALSK